MLAGHRGGLLELPADSMLDAIEVMIVRDVHTQPFNDAMAAMKKTLVQTWTDHERRSTGAPTLGESTGVFGKPEG